MATFTEEFRYLVQKSSEIFEYGGMYHKTDHFKFHLKQFLSATCNLKLLPYWNISCA